MINLTFEYKKVKYSSKFYSLDFNKMILIRFFFLFSIICVILALGTTKKKTTTKKQKKSKFESGDYSLKWTKTKESINFEFTVKNNLRSDNIWSAFAISKDKKMGSDDVVVCKVQSGNVSIERSYTQGNVRPELISTSKPSVGLKNTKASYLNNIISCNFTRAKSHPTEKRILQLNGKIPYYLLFAKGLIGQDRNLAYHGSNNLVSEKTFKI